MKRRTKKKAPQRPGTPVKVSRRGEAVINGVVPQRGMWLVNLKRQRVYGRVLRVNRFGEMITFGDSAEHPTRHAGQMLLDTGGSYATELPTGDGWIYYVGLHWVDTPPDCWGVMPAKDGGP